MSNLSYFLIFTFLFLVSSCGKDDIPGYVIITGEIFNSDDRSEVYIDIDGESKEIKVNESGIFRDTIPLKENYIYGFRFGYKRIPIYLEKGKKLILKFDSKDIIETINYQGGLALENNYLKSKVLLVANYDNIFKLSAKQEKEFLKTLKTQNNALDSLYKMSFINNEKFYAAEKRERLYYYTNALENYQSRHRYASADKEFVVSNSFYDELKNVNYKDTTTFRISEMYQKMLGDHFGRLAKASNSDNVNLAYFLQVDQTLPDGYAKDKLMFNSLFSFMGPNNLMEECYYIYKNSNPNSENFTSITESFNDFKKVGKGQLAPKFNLKNSQGQMVRLNDFKGKYLFIDVWATWCVPCILEFPHIEKLRDEYKNKNIEFIGISIDKRKAYDEWLTMIKEKELDGVQLFIGSNEKSQFEKDYAVRNIPRFILIGPEGKIISADCQRPSNPELKIILNDLLK